jgi:uncharacterized protein
MKSCKILVSIVLVALCWAAMMFPKPAVAIDFRSIRNPHTDGTYGVADIAELLSSDTEQQLNQLISKLKTQNGAEIVVVTVPDTQPSETPKQFATSLFNYWGIGKSEKDNGVLFLISRDDRRLEIETGYGIESIRPVQKLDLSLNGTQVVSRVSKKSILGHDRVQSLIDNRILPRFKQGDFDGGTLSGTRSLAVELGYNERVTKIANSPAAQNARIFGYSLGGLIILVGIVLGVNGSIGGGGDGGGSGGGGSWGGGDGGGDGGGSSGGGGDGGGW